MKARAAESPRPVVPPITTIDFFFRPESAMSDRVMRFGWVQVNSKVTVAAGLWPAVEPGILLWGRKLRSAQAHWLGWRVLRISRGIPGGGTPRSTAGGTPRS